LITLINILSFIVTLTLLHSLSRRYAERTCHNIYGLCSANAWLIYFTVFFSGLVLSYHIIGTAALVSGFNFLHITSLTFVVFLLWSAERWLISDHTPQDARLSYAGAIKQTFDTVRSVDRLMRWSAVVAAGIILIFILEAITRPAEGWDALVYHLPLAIKWMQQGSLAFIQESWKFQMPSNGDLTPLFLTSLGNQHILSLTSLPFGVLAMLAIYSLARRLSAEREEALFAALGFGTMPIVLNHTFTAMVDIFAAAFFLSSICLLLGLFQPQTHGREKRQSLALLAGLAFGLGLGARYTYVPLFLCMIGLCAVIAIHSAAPLQTGKWKQISLTVTTFGIGSLLTSIFWYIRNFMATGNPMHPLQFSMGEGGVKVSTKALLEHARVAGPRDLDAQTCLVAGDSNITHWLLAPWQDCWAAGAAHYSTNSGLGAVFATFIPVLMIVVIALTIATTIRRKQIQPMHILLLVALVFLAYWWLLLYNMIRFIFPVIGIFFVLSAVAISVFSDRIKRTLYALFLCSMIINGVLQAANPIQSLSSRLHHNTWSYSRYYNIPAMIDELPAGSIILNAADEKKNYPLYGSRWLNQVVTDRALLEPVNVTTINNNFIEQWDIEYIFYDTRQKWKLADEVNREVLFEQTIDESTPGDSVILYRILR